LAVNFDFTDTCIFNFIITYRTFRTFLAELWFVVLVKEFYSGYRMGFMAARFEKREVVTYLQYCKRWYILWVGGGGSLALHPCDIAAGIKDSDADFLALSLIFLT
jgi:hypothetical protein